MPHWLNEHVDDDCCDLTTTGRRTGKAHAIEIWFGVLDDTMYFISGNGPTADWYRNALAGPAVSIRVGDEVHHGSARAVVDADERRRVGDLMAAKYRWEGDASIGLTYDAWCYDVPVLAVGDWDG